MSNAKVAEALSGVLADTYVLQTKTQNYHWNVVGPQFHSLHIMFEGQYNELFAGVDEIAERIRQIGQPAPGTMAAFLSLTKLSETSATSAPGMVADLVACHAKVMARLNACLKLASQAGDDSTQDLMIRRLNAHDKAEWMLRATLGDESPKSERDVAQAEATTKPVKAKKKAKAKPAPAVVKSPAPTKVAKVTKAPKAAPPTKKPTKAATPAVKKPAKRKSRVAMG